MIERIVPPCVHVAEADGTAPAGTLFPAEQAHIATASPTRQREFTAVRDCARTALAALGVPPAPLVPDRDGAPVWPVGVVGSLTHCEGLRAAAVASAEHVHSIGIDAEPHLPLPPTVLRTVARDDDVWPTGGTICWERVLFCTKEAVFKAWFPLARRFLGFDEARIDIALDGTFTAHLLVPGPMVGGTELTVLPGRWIANDDHVAAAIVLAVTASSDQHQ